MLKTLNQIKAEFETIANDHRQINNYWFGSFLSAMKRKDDDGRRLYKYLIVTPTNVSHSPTYTSTTLLISVADRLLKGYEDQDDIHSDAIQILNDIYTTFFSERWQQFVDVDSDGSTTLFIDKSLDAVAGASMSVNLKIFSENNACAIPYENNSPINPTPTVINVSNSNDSYDVDTSINLSLPDITFTDSDGVETSVPSMENLICTPSTTDIDLRFNFDITEDTTDTQTITTFEAGIYTSISDDGASGTITLSINGGGFVSFASLNPLTLVNTDTIAIKRTTTTGTGYAQITGTY
jgi:hypothetical protein